MAWFSLDPPSPAFQGRGPLGGSCPRILAQGPPCPITTTTDTWKEAERSCGPGVKCPRGQASRALPGFFMPSGYPSLDLLSALQSSTSGCGEGGRPPRLWPRLRLCSLVRTCRVLPEDRQVCATSPGMLVAFLRWMTRGRRAGSLRVSRGLFAGGSSCPGGQVCLPPPSPPQEGARPCCWSCVLIRLRSAAGCSLSFLGRAPVCASCSSSSLAVLAGSEGGCALSVPSRVYPSVVGLSSC